jgi:ketosteroid isomerase-like protein
MSNQNIEATKKAYAAFIAGNLDAVLGLFHDSVEWTLTGESAISGTYRGKDEITALFQQLAEKSTTVEPMTYLADGDVVVVLTEVSVAGGRFEEADVYTFRGGKVIKAQAFGDTAAQERIFGTKRSAARV